MEELPIVSEKGIIGKHAPDTRVLSRLPREDSKGVVSVKVRIQRGGRRTVVGLADGEHFLGGKTKSKHTKKKKKNKTQPKKNSRGRKGGTEAGPRHEKEGIAKDNSGRGVEVECCKGDGGKKGVSKNRAGMGGKRR